MTKHTSRPAASSLSGHPLALLIAALPVKRFFAVHGKREQAKLPEKAREKSLQIELKFSNVRIKRILRSVFGIEKKSRAIFDFQQIAYSPKNGPPHHWGSIFLG